MMDRYPEIRMPQWVTWMLWIVLFVSTVGTILVVGSPWDKRTNANEPPRYL